MRKANYKWHFFVCALFESFLTRKKKLAMCEIISVVFTVLDGKKVNERGNETLNELTVGRFNSFPGQVRWKPIYGSKIQNFVASEIDARETIDWIFRERARRHACPLKLTLPLLKGYVFWIMIVLVENSLMKNNSALDCLG